YVAGARPPSRRALMGWGALAGASLLYSQEFGLCAIFAATIASLLMAWLSGGLQALRPGVVRAGTFLGGAALPLLVTALVYASVGKGARFVSGLFRWVALAGAGVHDNLPFPLSFAHLEDPTRLLEVWNGVRLLAFVAPSLVALVGALSLVRTWACRTLDP